MSPLVTFLDMDRKLVHGTNITQVSTMISMTVASHVLVPLKT